MRIEVPTKDLGARLQARRDEMGLSGTQMAKRAGISPTTYYGIENGKTEPRGATLRRLARAFGVSVEELLTEVPKAQRSPLEQARVQAETLKQREAESAGKLDAFWGQQWAMSKAGVGVAAKLLREVGADGSQRIEALDLLDDFIGLERRAEDRFLELHNWSLADAVSEEPLEVESGEADA